MLGSFIIISLGTVSKHLLSTNIGIAIFVVTWNSSEQEVIRYWQIFAPHPDMRCEKKWLNTERMNINKG